MEPGPQRGLSSRLSLRMRIAFSSLVPQSSGHSSQQSARFLSLPFPPTVSSGSCEFCLELQHILLFSTGLNGALALQSMGPSVIGAGASCVGENGVANLIT